MGKKTTINSLINKIEDMGWFYAGVDIGHCCYVFRKKDLYSDTIVNVGY